MCNVPTRLKNWHEWWIAHPDKEKFDKVRRVDQLYGKISLVHTHRYGVECNYDCRLSDRL